MAFLATCNIHNRTADSANLAVIFCPVLLCPQKAIVGIEILAHFWNPLIKKTWNMLSNNGKIFCCISSLYRNISRLKILRLAKGQLISE